MADATDPQIIAFAHSEKMVIVTLDADLHALIALAQDASPSVIRIRIEGLKAEAASQLITSVVAACAHELASGALVTVTPSGIRVRTLPIT